MKPWREIARPHQDVLSGTFQQSEFAADISQVVQGKATPEYQDAEKFFARTYITEGMRLLLISVAKRIAGMGGDPVIQLQTNFGGGKTHTLLAVYHLIKRSVPTARMPGIPELLDAAKISALPPANLAVIDGISLSPNQPAVRGALKIRTLWGHIAYQLLGVEGYELLAESDASGSAPGKEVLIDLLTKAAPCVLLLDELVAFFRQLDGPERLASGTFESNMSFIQALTESVKCVPNAVLLASLPESDAESAGSFGKSVLRTLEKYFGRLDSIWKPVGGDESFEIVRRRLFDSVGDPEAKEAVCREFADFYRKNKDKFPKEVQESRYMERLRNSYPIHPELFDRLYQDWSTLEKFQKTRGVLQYLAILIHQLWNSGDQAPLVMPGSIPFENGDVRIKSTAYLPATGWDPIVETEIDGPGSVPAQLDGDDPRFGSILAARRIARTIFFGTAPSSAASFEGSRRGLALEQILLGCAMPGQSVPIYEDALKRLRDKLHYLFADAEHFWFDTRPNLRREMESRKEKIDPQQLFRTLREITTHLAGRSSLFAGVHVFVPHSDIPDEIGNAPRLVLLPPELDCACSMANRQGACHAAAEILERRGEQPRLRRNRLFFLAPDLNSLNRLLDSCRTLLAWQEIQRDSDALRLNLDQRQARQVASEQDSARKILEQTVRNCYRHLMIPRQKGANQVDFDLRQMGNSESSLALAAEKLLRDGEEIIQQWAPVFLKQLLEENYFKDGRSEVAAQKVWQDCCSYYPLPRLLNQEVFLRAAADGVAQGCFGYAEGKEADGQYRGFRYKEKLFAPELDEHTLLIEAAAAARYQAAHEPKPEKETPPPDPGPDPGPEPEPGTGPTPPPPPPPSERYRNFFGSVSLDPINGAFECQEIMRELVSLFTMKGAKVTLKLDIEATSDAPFDENTVRAVRQNSEALNLDNSIFEK